MLHSPTTKSFHQIFHHMLDHGENDYAVKLLESSATLGETTDDETQRIKNILSVFELAITLLTPEDPQSEDSDEEFHDYEDFDWDD